MKQFKIGDIVRVVRPPKFPPPTWCSLIGALATVLAYDCLRQDAPGGVSETLYRIELHRHKGQVWASSGMLEIVDDAPDTSDIPEATAAAFAEMRLVVPAPRPNSATQVFFYEREFYPLSNFSAFSIQWRGLRFDTSEHAYHWEKFPGHEGARLAILNAISAHEAYKLAEQLKEHQRPDWGGWRTVVMEAILRAKASQHEYVRRKLLETGDREIVEDSWRDGFWGTGPVWGEGQNMLGKLWMKIRDDLRQAGAKP